METTAEGQVNILTSQLESKTGLNLTLNGKIEQIDGLMHLKLRDSTSLRLSQEVSDAPTDFRRWQVIPSTDSTGEISSVKVVSSEQLSPQQAKKASEDKCDLVGRVVQLGKKGQFVRFKVQRPGEKTLKPTLLNPDPRMKAGQLWQVSARLQGRSLRIEYAAPISGNALASLNPQTITSNSSTATTQKTTTTQKSGESPESRNHLSGPRVLEEATAPNHKALAALSAQTGDETNWQLFPGVWRRYAWEWEAINSITGQKARVQIMARGTKSQVYLYPEVASDLADKESATSLEETEDLVVTPLGAARSIGASCFKVEIGPYEIVLDCGTRPKGYEPLPALEHLSRPNLLLITHGHQDHIGAVPVFHNRWPEARMICTPGTREIAQVMLQDGLKVQQLNEDSPELFDSVDLERTLFRLETQAIGEDFEPLPGLKVRFINAGHILGAACIYMSYGTRSLLYTGDYNTTSSRTTTGLQISDLPEADILITESTYGADAHPARKAQETALIKAVASVVQAGGNVLIPAFALGRAQEILLAIRTSHEFRQMRIPVYVDGLVRAVTNAFRDHLTLLPQSVQNLVKQTGIEPFFDSEGIPPIIPIARKEERPLAMAKPSVIVASSGMLSGGASVYYAQTLLERENAAVFISGYTDEESPGRLLQNLETGDTIELEGKEITVRAHIQRFNLSAHADKVGLTQVIHKVDPQHLILIHGSLDALHELARSGDLQKRHVVHIPAVGEAIEYGQIPEHVSSRRQDQLIEYQTNSEVSEGFEVEVIAEIEGAWLRIPEEIVEEDPRWQMLADTGILKAKWDRNGLRLTTLTQHDLIIEEAKKSGENCCAQCVHFLGRSCQSEDSPMYSLQVDPSGYCPEFFPSQSELYLRRSNLNRGIDGEMGREEDDLD
ncbi:MAG: MBL fold metallo-hydrolase [Symploca sp. SIO2E9]|nr:MBL fold metallo-hydrolase [Symploca sp. SIO2E9]